MTLLLLIIIITIIITFRYIDEQRQLSWPPHAALRCGDISPRTIMCIYIYICSIHIYTDTYMCMLYIYIYIIHTHAIHIHIYIYIYIYTHTLSKYLRGALQYNLTRTGRRRVRRGCAACSVSGVEETSTCGAG